MPGGIAYPLGPSTRFQQYAIAASPLPKLPGARYIKTASIGRIVYIISTYADLDIRAYLAQDD